MILSSTARLVEKENLYECGKGKRMADYILDKNKSFEFTYSAAQQNEIQKIRSKYLPKEESKMEQLRKLDKKAEQPGTIASIAAGIIGMLLLGVGMCCTMVWNQQTSVFVIGIVVGIIGIIITSAAYPLYKKITKKQREKIAHQIIELTDELSF